MFPYFGSKGRLAHLYPAPVRGRVIEPFAGSARYSLLYRDREVWLNDLDPLIYRVWKYIQKATKKDIEALPVLRVGERLDQKKYRWLSDVEKDLIGYSLGYSLASPRTTCSEWTHTKDRCRLLKRRLLENHQYVRDWKITNLHYGDLPDVDGTWFVDPPYQHAKAKYRYHCIADYDRLAAWCRSRRGQVIVCEGNGANWLPFRPFAVQQVGTGKMYKEVVWTGPE
jgi:site-specific DNA-adenine methylase